MRQIYQDMQRSAMARSTERGFNGWYTYGFWYAAMTVAVSVAGLLVNVVLDLTINLVLTCA